MNFTVPPKNKSLTTFPCSRSNEITKEYYNMLLGPINNGEIFDKALLRIENKVFNTISYYLVSSY